LRNDIRPNFLARESFRPIFHSEHQDAEHDSSKPASSFKLRPNGAEGKRVRSPKPLTARDCPCKLSSESKKSPSLASKTLFTLQRERYSTKNILQRSVANDQMPTLKSSLLVKSNDLGGHCSGPTQKIFGPLT
jgi:hypothetical protein